MIGRNSILTFFFFLAICSYASASLLVSISPRDPGLEVLSLYPDEVGYYEVTIVNSGAEPAENVMLKAKSAEGLKILEDGVEKTVVATEIASIPANGKEIVSLKLKPSELSAQKLFLYLDYGEGEFTHLAATYLEVKESPLQINTSLSQTALDVGGEGHLEFSLKNNGESEIQNIKAELIVFQGLESMDGTIELASLASGEGYEAKDFLFRADPSATGKRALVIQISFEDNLGKHVIEKNFSVEIQSRETILYLIIAIIILLVFVAIVSGKKETKAVKKLEKPIAKELEGKQPKPLNE